MTAIGAAFVALVVLPPAVAGDQPDGITSLGDSFASGEGAPPFVDGTDDPGVNECHRSTAAHPIVIAKELGAPLEFWACSGSTVAALGTAGASTRGAPWSDPITDVGPGGPRSAIQRIDANSSGRVLLTVGGNDIGFGDIVSDCLLGSAPCTERDAEVRAELDALGPDLADLLTTVRRALGPAGQIVVVGYPRLLPEQPVADCDFVPLLPVGLMTVDEQAWANDITNDLNGVIAAAVRTGQDRLEDVLFVDVSDEYAGQELCRIEGGRPATTSPVIVGLDLGTPAHSFHPTGAGQAVLAESVLDHIGPTSRGGPTVGVVDATTGIWRLRDHRGFVSSFYFGDPGDIPIAGDWDCDGIDTPGMYRQSDGYVYLRNENSQGVADRRFFFGNPGDIPIAGDFNGDGCDTVSVYRPSESRVFIIDRLGSGDQGLGAATTDYVFGDPGDTPFVGDFDGDGIDTIGLHRDTTGLVYFRNSHTQGNADAQFVFGDPADLLVAGDWNGDGDDTPAVLRPSASTFFFRTTNTEGIADEFLPWAYPGGIPVAGVFAATGG